jgi:dihydrofolate reductase
MIAIAAMARNRVIGVDGRLPWHLPEDLRFFKRTTLGHVVAMGRKTWESIGKPLPGRENIVVSRQATIPGVRVLRSPGKLREPDDGRRLYVIGGAGLYTALLPVCSEILMTRVDLEPAGDVFFPPFEEEFDEGEVLERGPSHEIRRHRRLRSKDVSGPDGRA